MPMTTVVTIIVMIVIVARGGSSMVTVMFAHRMPIIAAIVSHALATCWTAVVLTIGGVPARTAVAVATACRSTACSLTTAAGAVASATGAGASAATFCHERQETRTRMELVRASTCMSRAIR